MKIKVAHYRSPDSPPLRCGLRLIFGVRQLNVEMIDTATYVSLKADYDRARILAG